MEYKGYGGGKVLIEGETIIIKEALQQEECLLSNLKSIKFVEPKMLTNGKLLINAKASHSIFFLKKDRDTFFKLYNFLSENSNAKTFLPTKKIGNFMAIDEKSKLIEFKETLGKRTINYCDILDYELIEDDSSIIKGGMGKSLAGGILFGGVGAIVGSNGKKTSKPTIEKMQLIIRIKSMSNSTITIKLISSSTKKSSIIYTSAFSQAQEAISTLAIIIGENNSNNENETQPQQVIQQSSAADEIAKFKGLLDSNIITQQEFDAKKKQLLGL